MRTVKLLIPALAAALLTGCVSTTHVEKDRSVNLGAYHTYAWVSTKPANDSVKATKVSDLAERNIHAAVNQELAKAGWKEAKRNPDVLLSYDVLVERGLKRRSNAVYSDPFYRSYYNPYLRRWGTLYYPSQFYGYDDRPESVNQGTLTINMIDARSDKTIWQGWTTAEVNSRNLTAREIHSSVRSIFRKFDTASR